MFNIKTKKDKVSKQDVKFIIEDIQNEARVRYGTDFDDLDENSKSQIVNDVLKRY